MGFKVRQLIAIAAALTAATLMTPAVAEVLVGQPVPSMSLPLLQSPGSGTRSLHEPGTVTYIDFWASWCVPCKQSFPWLDGLQTSLGGRGFRVVGINQDSDLEDMKRFVATHRVVFTLLADPDNLAAKRFNIIGMPTAYLIDRQGTVRSVHKGFRPSETVKLEKIIRELLDQP